MLDVKILTQRIFMKPIDDAAGVLEALLDPTLQKELMRINPRFNRADLIDRLLEEWPEGQVGFVRAIIKEFDAAAPGSGTRQMILRMITSIISEDTQQTEARPIADLSDEELAAKVKALAPVVNRMKLP
jgi:hypothetical protein